jgi:CMP-N,N'-diacetyllegionaminic acid synthase
MIENFVALIPARGGSKGLPRKNLKMINGLQLISHTIEFANKNELIKEVYVSTDDLEIAEIARNSGATIPFIRPIELSGDSSPMVDVIRHFLHEVDIKNSSLLLLDPTSPLRSHLDLESIMNILNSDETIDGVISVSEPYFNPLWVGVALDRSRRITKMNLIQGDFTSRQEVPKYFRINGSYYAWKSGAARDLEIDYLNRGKYVGFETSEKRSMSIDSLEEFELLELLLKTGSVKIIED